MNTTGTTIERLKEGVDTVVEKTREAVNDGLDATKDRLQVAAKRLDRRYRRATQRFQAGAAAVRGQISETKEVLVDGYTQTSRKLVRLDRDARKLVANNPRKAVLIAATLGLLVGLSLRRARPTPAEA